MTESNIYDSIGDDGLSEKLCLAACEATNQFMFIPKIERDVGETMVIFFLQSLRMVDQTTQQ